MYYYLNDVGVKAPDFDTYGLLRATHSPRLRSASVRAGHIATGT